MRSNLGYLLKSSLLYIIVFNILWAELLKKSAEKKEFLSFFRERKPDLHPIYIRIRTSAWHHQVVMLLKKTMHVDFLQNQHKWEQNLHWKLGQQTPSIVTLLANLETSVASGDYISAAQLILIAHSLSRPVLVWFSADLLLLSQAVQYI